VFENPNTGMDHHLDGGEKANGSRNTYGRKTVVKGVGKIEIDLTLDRQGNFDPQLIAKYQRRYPA